MNISYPAEFIQGGLGYQIPFAISSLGSCYLEAKQYQEGKNAYEKILNLWDQLGSEERQKQLWKATTYHELGRVAQQQREFAASQDYYQQALAIKIEFGDRFSQAGTYHQLGRVAQQQREFTAAQDYYQQALAIKIEFGDRFSQASTYYGLGALAAAESNYPEARANLQTALEIYVEYKDEYMAARARQYLEGLPE